MIDSNNFSDAKESLPEENNSSEMIGLLPEEEPICERRFLIYAITGRKDAI